MVAPSSLVRWCRLLAVATALLPSPYFALGQQAESPTSNQSAKNTPPKAEAAPAPEPAKPAAENPILAPNALVALASAHRERWFNPVGDWSFTADGVTGSGDSHISFKGPFAPPFTLSFKIQVQKGMRPRVFLGPVKLANERYNRNLALYPSNNDGEPFLYEEGKVYAVSLAVEANGVVLSVDGKQIMTSTTPMTEIKELRFSGGDWWSKGTTKYSEIVLVPKNGQPFPSLAERVTSISRPLSRLVLEDPLKPNASPRPVVAVRVEPRHTARVGGSGGGAFTDRAEDGGLLTGLSVMTADYGGHDVIGSVQPIFRGPGGTKKGVQHGTRGTQRTILDAASGYAIGAINVRGGDRVAGLSAVFMRVKAEGGGLDPEDSYTSEWVGQKNAPGEQVRLGTGRVIVGIFGACGAELDSIGLLESGSVGYLIPAAASTPAPVKREFPHAKAIVTENPAMVKVVSLQGEPLVEAASEKEGHWRKVPTSLKGATIFDKAADGKHNGVAEFTATTAGRVYLACNYDYQGNRSGNWTEDRWDAETFQENGWILVEGVELTSWENRVYPIFTKELKAGETARLRCNKYEPPYFITFAK